ncbi:MAG: hypothetical protein ACRCVT_08220 [Leadbetterella sp.]
MKKLFLKIMLFSTALLCQNCIKNKQNKGYVSPQSTESVISFNVSRGLVSIPVEFEGVQKNFLFDNGDDLTTINRKERKGRKTKVGTSSGGKATLGLETVDVLKINSLEFKNICARNTNLDFIEKDSPNLGGLIGQSIISKANWLIDYPNKKLTISVNNIPSQDFEIISVKNIRDPNIDLGYDGKKYSAFVDLGSTTALGVVEGTELATKLMATYTFKENTREIASAEGLNTITEKVGLVSKLKIGSVEFNNVYCSTRKSSSKKIRIGMEFFKEHQLMIDNTNKVFRVKK